MKTYKFRVMARIYEDVEVDAENVEEAMDKFHEDHGERFTQDWRIDGLPQAFCLNPDPQNGENMYDVDVVSYATGHLKVSAKTAEEAAGKAKSFHELIGYAKGFYEDFGDHDDEPVCFKAVNEEDDEDRCELTP